MKPSFKIFSTYLWNGKRAITTGYYSLWYKIFSNNVVWTNLPNTNKMCRSPNHRALSLSFFFLPFSLCSCLWLVIKKRDGPVITLLDDRVIKNLFTAHSLMLSGTDGEADVGRKLIDTMVMMIIGSVHNNTDLLPPSTEE